MFVVVDLLLADLGLPLPEGVQIMVLDILVDLSALKLLPLVAHNFNHADVCFIIGPRAHRLNSSEAGWQKTEARSDFLFDLANSFLGSQVLLQVEMILFGESLGLVDELFEVRS